MDKSLIFEMLAKIKSGEEVSNEENGKFIAMIFLDLEKEECVEVIKQGIKDPRLADLVWHCMSEVLAMKDNG